MTKPFRNRERKKIKKYGDILQIEVVNTYNNLTVKVEGMLNWVYRYCSDVDLVLKSDEDVFVNVNNFAAAFQKTVRSAKVLYGSSSPNLVNRGILLIVSLPIFLYQTHSNIPT